MRILAITTIRNEAPFILEWIAYHQHIGVTDFLVFSNDCDDGSDLLLDRLADRGIIHHVRNHSKGKKSVQWRALTKAKRHAATKAADWIYVTDVDEFLCIHAGEGTLSDLIAARPDAEGFMIPWRMFGNNDVVTFEDAPVLSQFTKAAPDALLWPWRAVQFKSLYRNLHKFDQIGVHRPKLKNNEVLGTWFDGNGNPAPVVPGTVVPTKAARYALAQINHYALGAMESFLVKVQRGKPNHSADPIDLAYWVDRNLNAVEDTRILRHADAVAARRTALMDDKETTDLHVAGVAWRMARIAALKRDSGSFYLLSRMQLLEPTKVLPMPQQHAIMRGLFEMLAAQDKD